jgi:hypothetical protein
MRDECTIVARMRRTRSAHPTARYSMRRRTAPPFAAPSVIGTIMCFFPDPDMLR